MFQTKAVEELRTHFMLSNFFPRKSCSYEIMWKNVVVTDRTRITIWRMSIACCIHKVTNTHSEQAIFITFPQQQWLHKRASILCYTYLAALLVTVRPCLP